MEKAMAVAKSEGKVGGGAGEGRTRTAQVDRQMPCIV